MPKPIKVLVLPNYECSIYGFSIVTKKRNKFFVGNDFKNWNECPEYLIEQFSNAWNETHGKKA